PPTPLLRFPLAAKGLENTRDVEHYLDQVVTSEQVVTRFGPGNNAAAEKFKQALLTKSKGLWMYLHFIVHEIKSGERSPWDLGGLPNGLTEYYKEYWKRWRKTQSKEWYRLYLPLLGLLAAAREPITAEQIVEWLSKTIEVQPLRALLREE